MNKNKPVLSIKELQLLTQKIVIELQCSIWGCIDELSIEEKQTLMDDLEKYDLLDCLLDEDTLSPCILEEFKETSFIDVERLINDDEYNFNTYDG